MFALEKNMKEESACHTLHCRIWCAQAQITEEISQSYYIYLASGFR